MLVQTLIRAKQKLTRAAGNGNLGRYDSHTPDGMQNRFGKRWSGAKVGPRVCFIEGRLLRTQNTKYRTATWNHKTDLTAAAATDLVGVFEVRLELLGVLPPKRQVERRVCGTKSTNQSIKNQPTHTQIFSAIRAATQSVHDDIG